MIKTIFYIVFYENDNVIYKSLNGDREFEKAEFFHLDNKHSEKLNKNIINILNILLPFLLSMVVYLKRSLRSHEIWICLVVI